MVKIARVFPRRTNATPTDPLAFTDGPGLFPPKVDEVHVSVTFTWDRARGEMLAKEWERVAPVKIGGPAYGEPGGEFVPGRYLKEGHVITSRGCPNRCWFCSVWKREGDVRTLPVRDGWVVTDDNLLACPKEHIYRVFQMLRKQTESVEFRGGLESRALREWHVALLRTIRVGRLYFAYDTPDDLEPLQTAGEMLQDHGFTIASHKMCAYVLCGWPKDTMESANRRMEETVAAGFFPFAMLWRGEDGKYDLSWRRFQREWNRPSIVGAKVKAS